VVRGRRNSVAGSGIEIKMEIGAGCIVTDEEHMQYPGRRSGTVHDVLHFSLVLPLAVVVVGAVVILVGVWK